ncbi:2996_t:CDS:2, partial [Funneliformis geosporum]
MIFNLFVTLFTFISIISHTKLPNFVIKPLSKEQGLSSIHNNNIIHRDFHSGNILIFEDQCGEHTTIGDLGLSKSATGADVNETYGIIPYMAPEVLQGQKYTTASDIYSFGMIMWEYMTGRRPFWD